MMKSHDLFALFAPGWDRASISGQSNSMPPDLKSHAEGNCTLGAVESEEGLRSEVEATSKKLAK